MPENVEILVYRLAPTTPDLLQFLLEADFNTIGKSYSVMGNDVYFTRYDSDYSVNQQWSNLHFTPYLVHESFHYYMQNDWPDGSRFSVENVNEDDLRLLEEYYAVLADIQQLLLQDDVDQNTLAECANAYVDIMQRRIEANADYVQKELEMEAAEGTATYVAIEASKRVGYDFGVMYFTNRKNVSFDEIMPQYRAGNIDRNYLADHIPYESGALLCQMMDALHIPDWQQQFNGQTSANPVTIYTIISDWIVSKTIKNNGE